MAASLAPPAVIGAAVSALTADQLFVGQPPAFFEMLTDLAHAADAARRRLGGS